MALPCTISMKLELRPIGMKDILTCKQLANPLNEKNLFDAEYNKGAIRGNSRESVEEHCEPEHNENNQPRGDEETNNSLWRTV